MSAPAYQLRPWREDDSEFLFTLHKETMQAVITAAWGWDEQWQQDDFELRLSRLTVEVIQVRGQKVGSLWWEWLPASLYIHQISILPSYQGRGLGTALVRETLARAKQHGKNVTLSVLEANPRARDLYERLGFNIVQIASPFIRMVSNSSNSRSE